MLPECVADADDPARTGQRFPEQPPGARQAGGTEAFVVIIEVRNMHDTVLLRQTIGQDDVIDIGNRYQDIRSKTGNRLPDCVPVAPQSTDRPWKQP